MIHECLEELTHAQKALERGRWNRGVFFVAIENKEAKV
jgi:hypothetical protein